MRKIKDLLRLTLDAKLSHEQIASAPGISKCVVTKDAGLASLAAFLFCLSLLALSAMDIRARYSWRGDAAAPCSGRCDQL